LIAEGLIAPGQKIQQRQASMNQAYSLVGEDTLIVRSTVLKQAG
jgi:hypothetical protein